MSCPINGSLIEIRDNNALSKLNFEHMLNESVEAAKNRALSRASTLNSLDKFYAEQKAKTSNNKNQSSSTAKTSTTKISASSRQSDLTKDNVATNMNDVMTDINHNGDGDIDVDMGGDIISTHDFSIENSHGIVAVIKQYITSLNSSSSSSHADTRLTRTLSDQLINKAIILQNSAPDTTKSASRIRNQIKSQKLMSKRKWKLLKAVGGATGQISEKQQKKDEPFGAQVSVFDLISLQRMWVSYVQMVAMNKYIDSVGSSGRTTAASSVSLSQLQAKLSAVSLVGAFVTVVEESGAEVSQAGASSGSAGIVGVHGYITKESANCYYLTRVVFDTTEDTSASGSCVSDGVSDVDPNKQLLSVSLLEQYAGKYIVTSLILLKHKCSIGILLPTCASIAGQGSTSSGVPNSLGEAAEVACIVRGKEFYPYCKERTGCIL